MEPKIQSSRKARGIFSLINLIVLFVAYYNDALKQVANKSVFPNKIVSPLLTSVRATSNLYILF